MVSPGGYLLFIEVYLFVGPRAAWDVGGMAARPQGLVDPLSTDSKTETRALIPLNAPRSTCLEVEKAEVSFEYFCLS